MSTLGINMIRKSGLVHEWFRKGMVQVSISRILSLFYTSQKPLQCWKHTYILAISEESHCFDVKNCKHLTELYKMQKVERTVTTFHQPRYFLPLWQCFKAVCFFPLYRISIPYKIRWAGNSFHRFSTDFKHSLKLNKKQYKSLIKKKQYKSKTVTPWRLWCYIRMNDCYTWTGS